MDDLGTRACSESGGEVQTLFSSFPDADALYSVLFKTEVFYYVITVEPLITHTDRWTGQGMGYQRVWV